VPPPTDVVAGLRVLVGSYTIGQGGRARGVSLLQLLEVGLDPVEVQDDDVLSVFDRSSLPPSAPPIRVGSPTRACLALWPPAGR
jgi:hypothetical protein